ncbi:hypothetical protein M413DRAFT_120145 [Hebeloma cylindrosporum]|uniref:Zn(2)-C6 fungal-type domain-containing protein n=1 Tax=Hebeloma cylindrosporum TaxID=76867 RepID=A0A0C2XY60_HEBCY|nr:hypothetical protein M413DRAFT_120145 [Hebeloma cylindrosporum h7]
MLDTKASIKLVSSVPRLSANMLSNESRHNGGGASSASFQTTKKRMIQRACDICRRKKTRCDGVQWQGTRCSNCKAYNLDCTYVEEAKKRGIPKSYVDNLEKRAEKLDKLLRKLCPDEALYNEFNASLDSNWILERSTVDRSALVEEIALKMQKNTPKVGMDAPVISGATKDNTRLLTEHYNEDDPSSILTDLKRMALKAPNDSRFFGKSSEATLARTAIDLKNEYMGNIGEPVDPKKPALKHQRSDFWTIQSWERESDETKSPIYRFPEIDLALHCIDLYFKHDNLYLPLLHRPTFAKSVLEGLYLTDDEFAPVFLLVCALGARHSDDPRVLLDGFDSKHSSGWKWFEQVQTMKRSLITPPTLYDLQVYCLSIKFLLGSSSPQSCWTLVGVAIQLAQDAGAHRRKACGPTLTPEEELWKRAFWVLVCMDRMVSPPLGRPCSIHEEDFDLDWPVDCDDEYWDNPDPEKRFKQPPNKPSLIAGFILYLKLHRILALSLRTIYSINQSKILLGFAKQQWEQDLVADLDSELNKWVDSVPDHLLWNPSRDDDNFFNQSVFLYAEYYYIQITIHRPFIPSPSKPSPLSFPSLAICTNAARSCIHVIHIQSMRYNNCPPHLQMAIFTAGVVLLLGIWGSKRSNLSTEPQKGMAEVHRGMKVLKAMERRWQPAGRVWDILHELSSIGELPLPKPSPPTDTESGNESDTLAFTSASESSWNQNQNQILETTAGSFPNEAPFVTEVQRSTELRQSTFTMSPHAGSHKFALPVYSNELGKLPVQCFGVQAANSQSQPSAQLHPQEHYWYATPLSEMTKGEERSEPTPSAGSITTSSLYGLRRSGASAPSLQPQRPSRRHDEFSLTSGISMAKDPYGMDPSEMVSSMPVESMMSQSQLQTPIYGLTPTGLPSASMRSGSIVAPLSSGDSSDGVRIGTTDSEDPMSARKRSTLYNQREGVPQQGELFYPLPVDRHTAAIWSNAPTGFELDKWDAYITEMMQDGNHQASG